MLLLKENVDGNFHRQFCAACKTPVVIVTDILHPEAKGRWNFSPTFSYRAQNVDGIFHRHFNCY